MSPSLQARAASAVFRAVPDRVIARTLTKPPRRWWPPFVPDGLRSEFEVTVTDVEAGQVATARPRSGASGRHVFYLHGGAYTLRPMHWDTVRPMLDQGWTVSMIDYPLAPEHTVDATVPMILAAWQQASAGAAAPVDIMGDSAGGGLAVVLLQQIRDRNLADAGRTVLFSPWVDLVMDDPVTIAADRHDPLLSHAGLSGAARMYAGARDLADPLVSPITGRLDDLGSMQLWVSTAEMFLAQCCRFADLAADAPGTKVDLRLGQRMLHDWPMLPIPEGRRALAEAVAFLG